MVPKAPDCQTDGPGLSLVPRGTASRVRIIPTAEYSIKQTI